LTTGHDPVSAPNPYQLPAARSINPIVPTVVEAAIQQAVQLQPGQRFQTVVEFRRALFMSQPLTPTSQPAAGPGGTMRAQQPGGQTASAGTRSGPWMWIALALVAVAIIVVVAVSPRSAPVATLAPSVPAAGPAPVTATISAPGGGTTPTDRLAETPAVPPTDVPSLPPTEVSVSTAIATQTPVSLFVADDTTLGRSVDGRDIRVLKVGYPDGPAVIMVGSIEGDQSDTSSTVQQLADYYRAQPDQVPNRGMLYLIPSLNPDGNASSQRLNSNGVDLNRNWDAANWKRDATCPGCGSSAGGSAPFSEPETTALRDLINSLSSRGLTVYVVVLHSTVNNSLRDQVFPGYTATGMHGPSEDLTRRVGSVLGYGYNTQWSYDTNGELIGWCAEQGISSVDIVSKKSSGPSRSSMTRVIAEILR
jgi:hypothetical protein